MRRLFLGLCSLSALAGCAGNVADYVGSRSGIVAPQLRRYGLDETQAGCVARHLGESLTPLQLRRLVRVASSVREGWFEPGRLGDRDLLHVASTMRDPQVRLELSRGFDACQVGAPPPPAEPDVPPPPADRPPNWLNLGAAPTGQSISVDAASLEQDGQMRRAWFRLTNPNQPSPTGVSYHLRIDCTARTIEALAHRRQNPDGSPAEVNEYPPDAEGPLPVEGGTVMEIAWLALCT